MVLLIITIIMRPLFAFAIMFFMYGFYYHFNNLRFKKSQNVKECSAAHEVISFVSSETFKCRLLK